MKLSSKQIREDLKNIRYYYSRQKVFDNVLYTIGENSIKNIAERYNEAIQDAPPKLFDLYISLYTQNHTQFSLSEAWGFSFEYISRLHNKLIKFIQAKFENEDIKKEELKK